MGISGFSTTSLQWFLVAAVFLLGGAVVSAVRKMLDLFSRKALLEGLPDEKKARLEGLLLRLEDYGRALRIMDQGLRLCFTASLSFAALLGSWNPGGPAELALGFAVILAIASTSVILILELIPSVVARKRPEAALRTLLPAIDGMYRALAPAGRIYSSLVRAGVRAVGGEAERTVADAVEEDILSAAEEGERKGILEEGEISMIESIIRFRDQEVSEVMTPRTEMVCIGIDQSLEDCVRVAIDCGHSRIPVFQETKDNIAGILYVKDLLRFWNHRGETAIKLRDVIRQAHFIPESKKISELFHEFKSQRFHIAIILDEFGGTSGLITIEDIIEEIVGEIQDEFEKVERPDFQRLGEDLVEVDARLPIRDLNERLGIDLPEGDSYETVGGFLFSALGKIPVVGDTFDRDRIRFEVTEADERKIGRLRIRIRQPESGEAPAETS